MQKSLNRGFTLIELLVVIAIIGILASVVLASLNSARIKSRNAAYLSQVKEYQKALEIYYSDNGTYPNTGSTWACIGTGHPSARCFGSSAYAESTSFSTAFRTAIAPYISADATAGPTNVPYAGALYRPQNGGNNYQILMLFEGLDFNCPIGVASVAASATANELTRCLYTHPL